MPEPQDNTFNVTAFMAALNIPEVYDQAMLSETEYVHTDKSDWIMATHIVTRDKIRGTVKFLLEEFRYVLAADDLEFLKSASEDLPSIIRKLGLQPKSSFPAWNNKLHGSVYKEVIIRLSTYGVIPSQVHDKAIKDTIKVMMDSSQLSLPTVLPVPPGFGKTTILKELIIDRLKNTSDWCALIVLERVDDIYKQIDEIKARKVNARDIEIWPTFRSQLKCPAGLYYFKASVCKKCQLTCPVRNELIPASNGYIPEPESFVEVKSCPAGHLAADYRKGICNNCSWRKKKTGPCPVLPKNPLAYNDVRVLYVTHEFYYRMITFEIVRKGLTHYNDIPRQIFIDERPRLVKTYQEHFLNLLDIRTVISNKIHKHLPMYDKALLDYVNLFKNLTKTYVNSLQQRLDKQLIAEWETQAVQNLNLDPEGLIPFQMVLDNGGYYEPKSYDSHVHATTVANYLKRIHSKNRTVILDGTGQFDELYDPIKYQIQPISINLKYPNLHFHFCNIELSKSHYRKALKSDNLYIQKFCNDIINLVGIDDTLVLCYKKYRMEFNKWLRPSNIAVDHFGNLLGKNDYSSAVNVVFAGVLTYAESDYGAMDLSVNGMCVPPDIPDRIKLVEMNQKLVGIYQQVYRSKLRNHNLTDEIHVYLPTKYNELRKLILARFLSAKEDVWLPKPVFPHGDKLRDIVKRYPFFSKQDVVREYFKQTRQKPTNREILTIWPGISESYASKLRARI